MIHYAVIDIGSNTVKMSLAEVSKKRYNVIETFRFALRLLEGDQETVHEEEIQALIQGLASFLDTIDEYQCGYRVFATSALRRASNQKKIIKRVSQELGIKIEVISGDEEASLVLEAHRYLFEIQKGNHLIFDIGGGSVEWIELKNDVVRSQGSVPLGALVAKNMFDGKKYTKKSIEDVFFEIQKKLQSFEIPRSRKSTRVLISGGNPSAVSKISFQYHRVPRKKVHAGHVTLQELNEVVLAIKSESPKSIADTFGVRLERGDLAVPAIVLIGAILDYIDVDFYTVSKTGIREGEIIRMMASL